MTQYGSEGDTFLRIALKSVGLRPDLDVTIFQTGGGANTVQALAAGKIHAGATGGAMPCRPSGWARRELASGEDMKVLALAGTLATTRRKHRARPPGSYELHARVCRSHSFFQDQSRSVDPRHAKIYGRDYPVKSSSPLYKKPEIFCRPCPADERSDSVRPGSRKRCKGQSAATRRYCRSSVSCRRLRRAVF